jgi:RNA polymerase sigma-70 factor (ECF subfamily)
MVAQMSRPEVDVDFASELSPHLDAAFRLAMVLLRDREAAEDAVQEAALKAWRKRSGLHRPERLRSWFLAIVANECRMTRRRRWWSVIRLADVAPQHEVSSSDDLYEAIRALRVDEQAPLFLFYFLDLPLDEVARVLGVSPGAARSRLYRAVSRLRLELTV